MSLQGRLQHGVAKVEVAVQDDLSVCKEACIEQARCGLLEEEPVVRKQRGECLKGLLGLGIELSGIENGMRL